MALKLSSIPNMLTIMRLLLVIPLVMLLLANQYGIALTVFVIAGLSDGLDGLLAKRFGWVSRFGSIADPLADKLLMVSSYFVLTWQGEIPWWLFVTILLRDLVIVGGAYIYHQLFDLEEIKPTYISKFNTFIQILLVVLVIFSLASNSISELVIQLTIYLVLASTLTSGAQYITIWGRKAFVKLKIKTKESDKSKEPSNDS
ncbi:MAG: CDP-alcohol phosphatidyltransferase [Gammaproteobacteria bacterium]|nr:MAG: CDP-alcohol phosphatidyltransferase [Gammaproteobacteria bacterium]